MKSQDHYELKLHELSLNGPQKYISVFTLCLFFNKADGSGWVVSRCVYDHITAIIVVMSLDDVKKEDC